MNKNHAAKPGSRRRQRKPGRHRKARQALQAARQRLVYVLDARYRAMTAQHAAGQRQRYPKDLDWAGTEEAAAITDNPSDLIEALESSEVSCQ